MSAAAGTARRRVVVTGAEGRLGTAVCSGLAGRWDLIPTDIRSEGGAHLDITDGDACRRAFQGADAVVHLAAVPDPRVGWDELLGPNIIGLHSVAEAAMAVGLPRLVLLSSLQAVSAYPLDHQVRSEDPPRPANLYGVTKALAETIGTWVSVNSSTTVVALRVGYCAPKPPSGEAATPRNLAAWLSYRDLLDLVRAAVEGPVEGFTVVTGVSANRYRKGAYGPAESSIGYHPVDDAWADAG
jgi:uronate dehydrogenase